MTKTNLELLNEVIAVQAELTEYFEALTQLSLNNAMHSVGETQVVFKKEADKHDRRATACKTAKILLIKLRANIE